MCSGCRNDVTRNRAIIPRIAILSQGIDGPGFQLEVEPDDATHDETALVGHGASSGPDERYLESSEDGVCVIDYEERIFEARLEGVIPAWGEEDKPWTHVLKLDTNITCFRVSYSCFLQTFH